MASKMTYNEWYGTLTVAQFRAYKKYNVSPDDHAMLIEKYGEDNHDAITAAVKRNLTTGDQFNWLKMMGE